MSGTRNGPGAAQRLHVRQFHGFAAWIQLVSAYNFVESRIPGDLREDDLTLAQSPSSGCANKKGAVSQQELADHRLVTKGNVVVSSTGLAPADSWDGVAPRRTNA